jgi:hypothetical protein
MSQQTTFTTPTGLELPLKPLPKLLILKLAGQSKVSFKKPQEARQAMQISILAEVVEAGVKLDLTQEQRIAAQLYKQQFEREYPGVITRSPPKFVYVLSQMSGAGDWGGELVNAIVALGPAPATINPLALFSFKRSGKAKK